MSLRRWLRVLSGLLVGLPSACGPGGECGVTGGGHDAAGEYERYTSRNGVEFCIPRGDDSVTSDALRQGRIPNHFILRLILEHHRGGSVIDVGAHLGSVALPTAALLADRGGQVFAFEPNRVNARALRESKRANALQNLVVYEVALADRQATLHFVEGKRSGQGRVVALETEDFTYDVAVEKLDSFEFPRIDFIKIDAEGHDLDIVLGGEELIRKDHPVLLIEMWDTTDTRGGLSREAAIAKIESLGYEPPTPPPGAAPSDLLFVPKAEPEQG